MFPPQGGHARDGHAVAVGHVRDRLSDYARQGRGRLEEAGIALRGLFIVDPSGVLR